jgi:hypothetical protein
MDVPELDVRTAALPRSAGYSSKLETAMISAKSSRKDAKRHLETRCAS